MNAHRMRFALARYFNWFSCHMMPEWFIDGGIADLLFVSRAGYATEIEIKCSLSDWNADKSKEKWLKERPFVARFFYAVPAELAERPPIWLPEHAGIIAIKPSKLGYDDVRIVREARRFKAKKLPADEFARMHTACYHRFWRDWMKRNQPA